MFALAPEQRERAFPCALESVGNGHDAAVKLEDPGVGTSRRAKCTLRSWLPDDDDEHHDDEPDAQFGWILRAKPRSSGRISVSTG